MQRHAKSGFTLIEILGVLVIISILAYFLVTRLGGIENITKSRLTRTKIETIGTALSEYENEKGDYPPSTFKAEWGEPPNNLNVGVEALYLALWQKGVEGQGLKDDLLVNVDGDSTAKRLTVNSSLELFELKDDWGNPLAYFHHADYDRKDRYQTEDPKTGEEIDSDVSARKSSKTGNYHNPHTFQIISSGPDGKFGTDDDIGNFSE